MNAISEQDYGYEVPKTGPEAFGWKPFGNFEDLPDHAIQVFHPSLVDPEFNPAGVVTVVIVDCDHTTGCEIMGAVWDDELGDWTSRVVHIELWREISGPTMMSEEETLIHVKLNEMEAALRTLAQFGGTVDQAQELARKTLAKFKPVAA